LGSSVSYRPAVAIPRLSLSFTGKVIPNTYVFQTPDQVCERTENWIREYNEERPHDSLGDLTPWEYRVKHEELENSNYTCN